MTIRRAGRRALEGAGLIIGLLVIGLGNLPRSLAAQETFQSPQINGVRIDRCLTWGTDCGQPAADEFCRRQGFKEAASFEVAYQIGPTVFLGDGKSCSNCDGFANIACHQKDQAPEQAAAHPQVGWKYEVLAQGKVIQAAAGTASAGTPLLELESIDVGGFRTARVFVHVMELSPEREWKLTKEAKLRVQGFHNIQGGSYPYFEAEIPMKVATYLSGWVEIPVIGPDLRIVVWGDNLPKTKMYADCTMYLLE